MVIYYAIFQNIISYGIIAWGTAHSNHLHLSQLQNKLLRIVNKYIFFKKRVFNLEQFFCLEAIVYHYSEHKISYDVSTSKTKNIKNL